MPNILMAFYPDPVLWIGVSYFKFIFSSLLSNQNSISKVPDTRSKQVDKLIHTEAWIADGSLLFNLLKICLFYFVLAFLEECL